MLRSLEGSWGMTNLSLNQCYPVTVWNLLPQSYFPCLKMGVTIPTLFATGIIRKTFMEPLTGTRDCPKHRVNSFTAPDRGLALRHREQVIMLGSTTSRRWSQGSNLPIQRTTKTFCYIYLSTCVESNAVSNPQWPLHLISSTKNNTAFESYGKDKFHGTPCPNH